MKTKIKIFVKTKLDKELYIIGRKGFMQEVPDKLFCENHYDRQILIKAVNKMTKNCFMLKFDVNKNVIDIIEYKNKKQLTECAKISKIKSKLFVEFVKKPK